MTIGEAFDRGRNNFDLLRLAAAVLVLLFHSFILTGAPDALSRYFWHTPSGGVAVAVFFSVSGFLVTRSALAHTIPVFVLSRVVRILPALALVTLLQVVVVGPLFTTLPLVSYVGAAQTLDHFGNATVFWLSYALPGVFETNPSHAVNGSLWTLPLETFCYGVVLLLARVHLLSRYTAWAVPLLVVVGYFYVTTVLGLNGARQGPAVFKGVQLYNILRNGSYFAVGAALWVYRDKIALDGVAVLLLAVAAYFDTSSLSMILAVSYGSVYLALRTPALDLRPVGDLSYGTYLYAFPVQQVIIALAGSIGALALDALALPATLGLAFLSWRLVEKPMLTLRQRSRVAA